MWSRPKKKPIFSRVKTCNVDWRYHFWWTGDILWRRFSCLGTEVEKIGERRQARVTPDGRGPPKKITPVRSPLFMLFRSPNMKAAIQLFTWCHVMFVDNKMAVPSSCSVDEAVWDALRKCGKRRTKEMYRFIVKKEGLFGLLPAGFGKKAQNVYFHSTHFCILFALQSLTIVHFISQKE